MLCLSNLGLSNVKSLLYFSRANLLCPWTLDFRRDLFLHQCRVLFTCPTPTHIWLVKTNTLQYCTEQTEILKYRNITQLSVWGGEYRTDLLNLLRYHHPAPKNTFHRLPQPHLHQRKLKVEQVHFSPVNFPRLAFPTQPGKGLVLPAFLD